ncbi:MAG: hypothetical protein AB7L66_22970 [Gemmatimonadales bacterium]
MDPVVFVATCDVLHLEIRLRDHIVFDPALSAKPMRCRKIGREVTCVELGNVGAVLGAIADDVLVPITACPPLPVLARAVGCDWTPTPPGRPEVLPGHPLRLV